tara:strand:- start:3461 stop:4150 length:690 start_codon:yes stop_codon:yes gene_type:complete
MKVLIVENNANTLKYLSDILEKEGFEVIALDNGQQALATYKEQKPDFICLDIMMPDITGYDICREIRKIDEEIPVIFISAKTEPTDKIIGLELGADDYIAKPFDIREVIARIRAVVRRCYKNTKTKEELNEHFGMGSLEVYPKKLKAIRDDKIIDLSLREVKILSILYNNKNDIVTKDDLLDYCWGEHITPESRTVAWHISQLRKRIEIDPKQPTIVVTVHGVGYKYEE